MARNRNWTLRSVAIVGLAWSTLSACGDEDEPSGPPSELELALIRPSDDAVLFAGATVEFEVQEADAVEGLQWEWTFGDGTVISTEARSTDHVYTSPGTYAMRVRGRALDGERVTAEGEVLREIEVLRPVDLTIVSAVLTSDRATVGPGDPFRLTYDLVNVGGSAPLAFDTGIFAVPAAELGEDATVDRATFQAWRDAGALVELGRDTIDTLGGQGAQASRDLTDLRFPASTTPGTYGLLVVPDVGRVLVDADEANDARVATRRLTFANVGSDGADLTVTDVSVRPTRVNVLNDVRISAVVSNLGNQPALSASWEAWLSFGDRALDDDDLLLGGGEVSAIVPGAPVTIDDVLLVLDPPRTELGEYFVLVVINPDGAVEESDASNNIGVSPRIVVTDEEVAGIDVVAEAFEIAPRLTFINGSIETVATIANRGTQPTQVPFFCRIYLSEDGTLDSGPGGDRTIDTISVPALGVDESVEITRVSRISPILSPGDYRAFLYCDPVQTLAESDVGNNVLALDGELRIASEANVNLVVEEASVTPSEVDNGDEVAVRVRICNTGSNGSTPSTLRVHISRDADYDPSDTVLLQSRVPPIEPGACLEVGADVPAVCDTFVGAYQVFAVADAAGEVPELDETDNVLALGPPLIIRGLVCSCVDDRYEPNNAITTAALLNPGIRRHEELTMCSANVDWYRVPLLRGETIRAAITFDNARGNLDLVLYGRDRSTELAASRTSGDREEVSYFVVPQNGDYYLRVQGREAQDRNVYDLELDVSAREPGVDLAALQVRVAPETPIIGQTVQVTFDVVNLGTETSDESLARVYLTSTPDLDPLLAPRLGEFVIPAVTDRITRTVDVALPLDAPAGTAYVAVEVDARNELAELNESNNVGYSPQIRIDGDCYDAFEPNNTLAEARALELPGTGPTQFTELLACSDNRDFYEVCVADGHYLDWSVAFDTADGDIDLRLYDETDREIARSEGVTGTERVRLEFVNGERCYRLEVYAVGPNREIPYTMLVDTAPASDDLACSRIEEPNNEFGSALELREILDESAAICPLDDTDFYRVQLSAGTDVVFRLAPADGADAVPAQLRLALFNPSRTFITNTISATEEIRYRVALTGSYFLRVRSNGAGPRNQPYRIEIEGVTGTDLVATDLAIEPSIVGPGDPVRFSFQVANTLDVASPAAHYAVWLSEDTLLDDDDVLLRELELAPLAGLSERVEGRRVTIPASLVDGGTFHLIVELDNRGQVVELSKRNNLAVAGLLVTPRCVADLAEPNNFPFEAWELSADDELELTLCADDVDWFAWTPTANGPVSVSLEFEHATGDLDLYAFTDPLADPVAISDSITDNEQVTVAGVAGETLLFRVDSFYGETNTYTLRIE